MGRREGVRGTERRASSCVRRGKKGEQAHPNQWTARNEELVRTRPSAPLPKMETRSPDRPTPGRVNLCDDPAAPSTLPLMGCSLPSTVERDYCERPTRSAHGVPIEHVPSIAGDLGDQRFHPVQFGNDLGMNGSAESVSFEMKHLAAAVIPTALGHEGRQSNSETPETNVCSLAASDDVLQISLRLLASIRTTFVHSSTARLARRRILLKQILF